MYTMRDNICACILCTYIHKCAGHVQLRRPCSRRPSTVLPKCCIVQLSYLAVYKWILTHLNTSIFIHVHGVRHQKGDRMVTIRDLFLVGAFVRRVQQLALLHGFVHPPLSSVPCMYRFT